MTSSVITAALDCASLVEAHGAVEDVSTGEAEGGLEVGRREDLLAHNARLEAGRVLLYRVEDHVGVLLAQVLRWERADRSYDARTGFLLFITSFIPVVQC